jgi:serine phosphatase RsbU (regulator of sigma subunit)
MLDYPRVTEAFKEAAGAGKIPSEISQHLFAVADKWRGPRPQDDDITIVVIRVKAD